MLTLFHHPMFAACRFVRLAFGEYGEELALIEEKPWARRKEFLALNPAGTLPVLLAEGDVPIVGAIGDRRISRRDARRAEARAAAVRRRPDASAPKSAGWPTGILIKTESEVTGIWCANAC